jgi:hypothetical protein
MVSISPIVAVGVALVIDRLPPAWLTSPSFLAVLHRVHTPSRAGTNVGNFSAGGR